MALADRPFSARLRCDSSRRPDALTNPQFYGEDGTIWYAQAYNQGWFHVLSVPQAGYLQVLPRLVAGLCMLFPLWFAPLLMNLFGLFFQALPVAYLLSSRCEHWGSWTTRGALAAAYIAIPNSYEIHMMVTNAQWHVALLACLIVFLPAAAYLTGTCPGCSDLSSLRADGAVLPGIASIRTGLLDPASAAMDIHAVGHHGGVRLRAVA